MKVLKSIHTGICQVSKKKTGGEMLITGWGTLSVKFGIYVHQITNLKRVLGNCSTYFFIILFLNIYILE